MEFLGFQSLKVLDMSEQKLQKKILDWLKKNNFYAFKTIVCNRKGILDINGCTPRGRFFAIEVKFGSNKCSKLQLYNIDEIFKRNGIAFAAWDLDTVVRILGPKVSEW